MSLVKLLLLLLFRKSGWCRGWRSWRRLGSDGGWEGWKASNKCPSRMIKYRMRIQGTTNSGPHALLVGVDKRPTGDPTREVNGSGERTICRKPKRLKDDLG